MAKKKAAGSKAGQGTNLRGKRLGLKVSGGASVLPGSIITRQRGTLIHPGDNVGMGRDFTLYAKSAGVLNFRKKLGRKFVDISTSDKGN